MADRTESSAMGQVIQIDKARIADHLGEMDLSRKVPVTCLIQAALLSNLSGLFPLRSAQSGIGRLRILLTYPGCMMRRSAIAVTPRRMRRGAGGGAA